MAPAPPSSPRAPHTRGRRRLPTSCAPTALRSTSGSSSRHRRSATGVGGLEIEDLRQGLETVVRFKEAFR
jgi:hypothetical protein